MMSDGAINSDSLSPVQTYFTRHNFRLNVYFRHQKYYPRMWDSVLKCSLVLILLRWQTSDTRNALVYVLDALGMVVRTCHLDGQVAAGVENARQLCTLTTCLIRKRGFFPHRSLRAGKYIKIGNNVAYTFIKSVLTRWNLLQYDKSFFFNIKSWKILWWVIFM